VDQQTTTASPTAAADQVQMLLTRRARRCSVGGGARTSPLGAPTELHPVCSLPSPSTPSPAAKKR